MRRPGRVWVPDEVRRAADLAPHERVLAAATTVDDDTVLATTERLVLVSPAGRRWARPWSRVDEAGWDAEAEVLRVVWLAEPTSDLALAPGPRARLPEVVRERVESSVVASRRADVRDRPGARVVVRRGPDGLVLQVVPDPGARLDDPALVAAVESVRRELADEVGATLPPGALDL